MIDYCRLKNKKNYPTNQAREKNPVEVVVSVSTYYLLTVLTSSHGGVYTKTTHHITYRLGALTGGSTHSLVKPCCGIKRPCGLKSLQASGWAL